MEVYWEQGVDGLRCGQPHLGMADVREICRSSLRDGCESVTQSVVENQVVLCSESQDTGGLAGPVTEEGEIPVRSREGFYIGASGIRVVGQAQSEVAGFV